MTRTLLVALLFAAPAFAADDPILADLDKAKVAHAKELRILRQNLLDDIDKIIRQTNDMGGGIDYMLRERKGFAESGVTPILPKLKGASDNYLEAKSATDGTLEAAYATAVDKSIKAGMLLQGSNLKVELKAMRDARQGIRNPPVLPPVAGPKDTPDERPNQRLGGGGAKPGEEREFEVAKGVAMRFCWIPAGEAQLGSPKEERDYVAKTFTTGEPIAYLDGEAEVARGRFKTKGFWLGKYEVTQREWQSVMGNNPSNFKGVRLPVEMVSWDDSQAFLKKCGVRDGAVRLPHEDEWEYACRGGMGNKQPFYWGDDLNGDKGNCVGNKPYGKATTGDFLQRTVLVGSYETVAPHPWGLCDMHGNVWEWCDNAYSTSGTEKALRGGGWDSVPGLCRSSWRSRALPSVKNLNLGFRVALASVNKSQPKSVDPTTPNPEPKSVGLGKDDNVEKEVAQAKANFAMSTAAAKTALLGTFDQAKLNVASAMNLTDAAKLTYMDALAKDRASFEKEGTRPRHPALQTAAKRYDDAIGKAREEFSKAVNEAAKVYVNRKDTANYEALLREKQRFLASPTATK